MRILAIRGENLASLRQFDVDLEDLAGRGAVGLFAITGPTGAGKSTLLDALCLALYDKTPRLGLKKSKHAVGRDPDDKTNLGAADVRNILRRGAVSGHAEVDFVGYDGCHYQARWSVRRARDQLDGKIQKQKIDLFDLLDGQSLSGSTKSATLKKICALVGLEFDQFRRSVLLAQGDFDAFLRADAGDRGALLERMTGTDIYKRLSIAAFERHKEARHVLQSIEDRLGEHAVLSPARRARLMAEVSAAPDWVDAAKALRAQADDDWRWHQRAQTLDADIEDAMQRAEAADAEQEAAAPRWERVKLAQKAAPLQPLLEAADRAATQAKIRVDALATAKTAAQHAQEQAAETHAAVNAAQAEYAAAQAEKHAAAADLDLARGLDAKLESARAEHERRGTLAQAAEAHAERAQAQVDTLNTRRDAVERRAQAATQTLTELSEIEPLQARRLTIRDDAMAWLRAEDVARAAAGQITAATRRVTDVDAAHQVAKQQAMAARAQLDDRKAAVADQPIAALADATERARSHRDALADHVRYLEQMQTRALHAAKLTAQIAEQSARIDAEGARRPALEQAQSAAEARLTELRATLEDARALLQLSRAVEDLSAHRAALHSGDPCPLCGATEHPGIDPALVKTDHFQARVAQAERDLESTQAALQEARTALSVIAATLDQAERNRGQLNRDLQTLIGEWGEARANSAVPNSAVPSSAVPADPSESDALAQVEARLSTAQAEHAAAAAAFKAAKAQQQARQAAEQVINGLRDAVDAADAKVKILAEARHAAKDHKADTESKARDAKAVADRAQMQLSPLLDWVDPDQLQAAPAATLDALEGQLDQLSQAQSDSRDVSAHRTALQAEAADILAKAGQAANAAKDARSQANAAIDLLRGLESRRADVFDGRAVASVSATFDARIAEAADALDKRRRTANTADVDAEGAKERLGSAVTARNEAESERDDAAQRLRDACAHAELDRAALDSVRALSQATLAVEAKALAALRTRRDKAHSVVEERCAKRGEHDARQPPVDAASAQANWTRANQRYDDTVAAKASSERALDQDDAARDRCAALSEDRAAAEADRTLWGQLDEVIGSASGAKFREFAQSLTLNAVIEQANHHLRTLARRYQLMRVPKENLALQVIDRDMADEVRTVKSLSGGETFLVSLALALGLASLSARDTRIYSLFIDEGFGSLDSGTLDVVLDALDELQANGRQIGLISHVPGLAQRIGVQVRVEPTASGLSAVTVSAGG